MFFKRKPRKGIIILQLTALIDIFSILIIFLIKGTVFGVSAIEEPRDIVLPYSRSKESVEAAPQVTIGNGIVKSKLDGQVLNLELFRPENSQKSEMIKYKELIKKTIADLADEAKTSGVLLNILADRKTPYKDVFDVIKVYRDAGYQSVLFIATGADEK